MELFVVCHIVLLCLVLLHIVGTLASAKSQPEDLPTPPEQMVPQVVFPAADQQASTRHLFQEQGFLLRFFTHRGYCRRCLAHSSVEQTPHQLLCANNLITFPSWEVDVICQIHKAYVFTGEVFVLKLRNYFDSKYLEIKLHHNDRI